MRRLTDISLYFSGEAPASAIESSEPTRCKFLQKWYAKISGKTTSTRGFIISLVVFTVAIIVFGQLLHLADPHADRWLPSGREQNEPPIAPPSAPPSPPSLPNHPTSPPLPPFVPPPIPPPDDWWQRRQSIENELSRARWELLAILLACVVLPGACVGYRYHRRRPHTGHQRLGGGNGRARVGCSLPSNNGLSSSHSGESLPVRSNGGSGGGGGGGGGMRMMEIEPPPPSPSLLATEGQLSPGRRVMP